MVKSRPASASVAGALVLAAVASALASAPLAGQFRLGGQGVYRSQVGGGEFGYGGRVEVDLGLLISNLGVAGVYNTFPCGEGCSTLTEAGGQVTLGTGSTYLGLNLLRSVLETGKPEEYDLKLSAVVGFRVGGLLPIAAPFLEVRQSIGSGLSDQAVAVGVLVGPSSARRAPRRSPR